MTEPMDVSPWFARISAEHNRFEIVDRRTEQLVAVLANPGTEELATASQLAMCPVMIRCLIDCHTIFRVIAREQTGELHEVGTAMVESIGSILVAAGLRWEPHQG